ncbi:MAG: GTP-binding protein [Candidatus Woesearchaeota archaeon]
MDEISRNILPQKIKELEDELAKTKYNKRTQHAIGLLKAKIALLKEKHEQKSKKGGPLYGFAVKKTGDATVVFFGYPSVGKSTLLNRLTNAKSAVAGYAFTTVSVIPGLMDYNNTKIQLLDIPGIIAGAATGSGRGREVLAIVRNADLLVIIVEALHTEQINILKDELYRSGVRINQKPPQVKITNTMQGGIVVDSTIKLSKLGRDTIRDILREFRIMNGHVLIREDISTDQLIDVLTANCKYLPCIVVANKSDLLSQKQHIKGCDLMISAKHDPSLEELRKLIFLRLELIRVFCKEAGKPADMQVPLILKKGSNVEDVCLKLHRDFVPRFKIAKVWGKSAKFPGQQLGINHVVQDMDIVELHLH